MPQLSVLYFDAISQDLRLKDMSLTFTSKETTYDSIYNIINNYTFFIRDVENSSAIKLTEQLQFISNSLQENNQNAQIIIFADSPQAEDFRQANFSTNSVIILGNAFASLGDNYITLGRGDWISNTVEKLKNNLR